MDEIVGQVETARNMDVDGKTLWFKMYLREIGGLDKSLRV